MEFDEINRILDMVREHELSEFELEREGFKIRIKKGTQVNAPAPYPRRPLSRRRRRRLCSRGRRAPWKPFRAPRSLRPMRSTLQS